MNSRKITEADLVQGAVIRMMSGDFGVQPFSDCVIDRVHNGIVHILRPYAYRSADAVYILTGVETFNAPISRFLDNDSWHVMLSPLRQTIVVL